MLTMRYMSPCADLGGRITSYYVMESPPGVDLDMHDYAIPEWPNLRCLLRGNVTAAFDMNDMSDAHLFTAPPSEAYLFGASTKALKVHLQGPFKLVGAGLFPRGWRDLIGVPASDWTNRMDRIDVAWGHDPATVWSALAAAESDADIARLLDQMFLQRLKAVRHNRLSPAVENVEALLVDQNIATVEMIAERTGMSLRQIERISLNGFGLSPKQVIRKFRFLRTVTTLAKTPNGAWRDMIDELYFDQSHFIRDFKAYTGITPTEYQKNPPILIQGYLRSLGTAISLRTLPANFEFGSPPDAPTPSDVRPVQKTA